MNSVLPIVAIIGRPNVGKSSLFNRLIKEDRAIVSDIAGTTRNIVQKRMTPKNGPTFLLVDTAGILEGEKKYAEGEEKVIDAQVQEQVRLVLEEAHVLLFVVDGAHGLHPDDREAASLLHKGGKPVFFVMNKCDSSAKEQQAYDFSTLGFGLPMAVSASHKKGIDELLKNIVKELSILGFEKDGTELTEEEHISLREKEGIRMALIGTPNVGKSALLNTLLGEKIAVVSDVAGTTRDMLDTLLEREGKKYTLIDTAGIRRRGKIEQGIETWSIMRTMGAIERADVVVCVLDALRGLAKQDMHVMEAALEAKKGIVLLVNKWDMIKSVTDLPEELQSFRLQSQDLMSQYLAYMKWKLPFLPWAPVLFVSAHTGRNVEQLFGLVDQCFDSRQIRIDTGRLNSFVKMIVEQHKPSGTKAVIPKISYATQVSVSPPHFVFFVNKKEAFHFSYLRYLENKLRDKWEFFGTPIIIEMKNKTKIDYSDEAQGRKRKYGYNKYHAE